MFNQNPKSKTVVTSLLPNFSLLEQFLPYLPQLNKKNINLPILYFPYTLHITKYAKFLHNLDFYRQEEKKIYIYD